MKIKLKRRLFLWMVSLVLFVLLLLAGESIIIKSTGQIVVEFIEDHAIPYVLKTDDVAMACEMTDTFALVIPALAQIDASPYKLALMFNFLSGSCSEFKAWEEELRYLRATHAKNVTEAQDARISQKRYLSLAARRQLKGYRNMEIAYPEIPGSHCPEFDTENDEFYWLVGLMDGLQAVLNDLASEGSAKVPLDISFKVGRGAECLNNEKWWGLPNAIQAAFWISFPGNKPEGVEPVEILNQAVQTGLQQGMRIVQVIAAKIYIGLGDSDQVKGIIHDNVAARINMSANPRFLFFDEITTVQLQAISDYMWTEKTGKRTPTGGLGSFWDDPKNTVETIDIINIL